MRKGLRMLLLGAVFTVLLCTSALAADSGIHTITKTDGYDVVAQTADKRDVTTTTSVTTDNGNLNIYAETERVKFTVNSTDSGTQYLVFVLTEQKVPTSGNIAYIDQLEGVGTGSSLDFYLYPNSLVSGITYYIYISSTSQALNANAPVASFQYYAPYKLGDTNADGKIDIDDVTVALLHTVKKVTLTGTKFLAADVTRNSVIDVDDVGRILLYTVKKITSF